jgi:ankyrin repeat protein
VCVGILLSAGALVNTVDAEGKTALMEAARYGSLDAVKRLLAAGADVNVSDKIGWTALMAAVIHGTPEMVSVLLRAGADVNARDYRGETALKRLRKDPHPDWVERLFVPGDARRHIREHQEIDQILRAAGAT